MRPNPDPHFEPEAFTPADALDVRRHGPRGYVDDQHYKPWLRDEFTYRCLYCACREVWFADGDRSFSVEHIRPTSQTPEGLTDYDTLVYACCQCNAARGEIRLPLDPTAGMRQHLEVSADGTIRGLTPAGADFIRICRLDRPNLVAFRRLILDVLRLLRQKQGREATELRRRYLGYPANLPDLSALKPPGGNSRPEGIERSAFACRARGELPEVY
jgi:hypothetical protein